jgi:hypothetical protein
MNVQKKQKNVISAKGSHDILADHCWYTDSRVNHYGEITKPYVKKSAVEKFQEAVLEYARELAAETNRVARDQLNPHAHWAPRDRYRLDKNDIELAVQRIKIGLSEGPGRVEANPCPICGKIPKWTIIGKHGVYCPNCEHLLHSRTLAYEPGDRPELGNIIIIPDSIQEAQFKKEEILARECSK